LLNTCHTGEDYYGLLTLICYINHMFSSKASPTDGPINEVSHTTQVVQLPWRGWCVPSFVPIGNYIIMSCALVIWMTFSQSRISILQWQWWSLKTNVVWCVQVTTAFPWIRTCLILLLYLIVIIIVCINIINTINWYTEWSLWYHLVCRNH